MKTFWLIYQGFWTGVGVEISVLALWVVWRVLHGKFGHRIHAEHWLHILGEYFD